jgi:predicted lipid-binding transport protein (Tim44 family)
MAMGEFQQYFDIILFAMIAGFLVLRLRSVLGRRTGNERRRELFVRRSTSAAEQARPAAEPGKVAVLPPPDGKPAAGLAESLDRLRRADPSFDPPHFIEGARIAFEMIVSAFAAGDKEALRPLLSDEVYRQFTSAIDERAAARESLETRIERLDGVDIVGAELADQAARVTVELTSHQVNVTRAMDGSIVDGDPQNSAEKTDRWTFARNIRSPDPNWVLVATGSG